jgi:quinoprotein glucose dehydrogenase
MIFLLVAPMAFLALAPQSATPPKSNLVRGNAPGEWRYWGADAWSSRYSPLDQINAANFNTLQIAWQFKVGDMFGEDEYFRSTPLYANGKLISVAGGKRGVVGLNPGTGELLWKYGLEEGIRYQKSPRPYSGRGLAYWTDGTNERALVVTPGYHLVALDAKTGVPDPKFGKGGVVDLMDGLGYQLVPLAVDDDGPLVYSEGYPARKAKPGETWDSVKKTGADGTVGIDPALGQLGASSPPIVVGDILIVGNSAIHGYYPIYMHNLGGAIRGFDIRTGKQLWKFNTIPQPGEFGAETWENGSKIGTTGVGKVDAWAPYSADPDLGIVYIPTGMGLVDEYGGHRPGNNLFGTSVVALDVKTGQRKWHYQFVHHDIWDYDTPMAPNLLDVTINGQPRKILAQTTKQGFVYVLDRVTGQPIWPIVETPVGKSDVPGEKSSPTQPIPSKPAPFSQQGLVESDLIDYTPEIKAAALALAKKCKMGPYFIPGSTVDGKTEFPCSWYAPGASGGVNIDGGTAADPDSGFIYVGGQSGMATITLAHDPCSEFPYSSRHDACGQGGVLPPPPGYTPSGGGRRGGGAAGGGGGAAGGGGGAAGAAGGGGGAAAAGGGAGAAGAGGGGARGAGGGGGGGRGGGGVACADVATATPGTSQCGGVSIVKPKEFGGVTAYNLKTGDKAWWIPNGGFNQVTSTDPMFAGVTLPPVGPGGQPQVINTKTLVIYGTGRSGGARGAPPQIFAVDKATGKQVGAVQIPSKTTAVPMTFMHQGKQYVVFATGTGVNTSLIALTLPTPGGRGGGPGGR